MTQFPRTRRMSRGRIPVWCPEEESRLWRILPKQILTKTATTISEIDELQVDASWNPGTLLNTSQSIHHRLGPNHVAMFTYLRRVWLRLCRKGAGFGTQAQPRRAGSVVDWPGAIPGPSHAKPGSTKPLSNHFLSIALEPLSQVAHVFFRIFVGWDKAPLKQLK